MIRISKHNISPIANTDKKHSLEMLFKDYRACLEGYVSLILKGALPLKKNLSSKGLPIINIAHSRYRQLIYKNAAEIVRSQIKSADKRRFKAYKKAYAYFKKNRPNHPFAKKKYKELNLKPIKESKYFSNPEIKNVTINLDYRFFNIRQGNHFDSFIKITLPYFKPGLKRAETINIPLKHHRHSLKFKNGGFSLKNVLQLKQTNGNIMAGLVWEKQTGPKTEGKAIGLDMGYKKLLATSEGEYIGTEMEQVYEKIYRKQPNSKAYKRALRERDILINYYCNQLILDNVKTAYVEKLKNVKKGNSYRKSFKEKLKRWSYRKTKAKLGLMCEERGIMLEEVPPAYTSQKCSNCGSIHKESRKGEQYLCIECGYEIDADYNAAINILNRGAYSPPAHPKEHFS